MCKSYLGPDDDPARRCWQKNFQDHYSRIPGLFPGLPAPVPFSRPEISTFQFQDFLHEPCKKIF